MCKRAGYTNARFHHDCLMMFNVRLDNEKYTMAQNALPIVNASALFLFR